MTSYSSPGNAAIPTDEYVEDLRSRVRGDIAKVALFEQYLDMVATLREKLARKDPHAEIDRLVWQIGLALKELESPARPARLISRPQASRR
jgi:hypothetical protein